MAQLTIRKDEDGLFAVVEDGKVIDRFFEFWHANMLVLSKIGQTLLRSKCIGCGETRQSEES